MWLGGHRLLCAVEHPVCAKPQMMLRVHEMEKKGTLGEVLDLIQEEEPSPEERTSCAHSFRVDLVARKLEKTQELLAEVQGLGDGKRKAKDPPWSPPDSESEQLLLETERLLGEASWNWSQAKRGLQEVRELRDEALGKAPAFCASVFSSPAPAWFVSLPPFFQAPSLPTAADNPPPPFLSWHT